MTDLDQTQPERTYRPLERDRASDRILADLRDEILDGRLTRGTKLPPERELAHVYGVSGPTIREAVRGLTAMQLLEVRHGSGTYVTGNVEQMVAIALRSIIQFERVGFADVLGVLEVLNAHAAELAAERATEAEIDAMRAALDRVDRGGDATEVADGLTGFLHGLAEAAHNPLVTALCKFLADIQIGLARGIAGESLPGWRKISARLAKDRLRVVDAIADGDPSAAAAATRRYHQRARALIEKLPGADTPK